VEEVYGDRNPSLVYTICPEHWLFFIRGDTRVANSRNIFVAGLSSARRSKAKRSSVAILANLATMDDMRSVTSTLAKNQLGQVLETALTEPVTITRTGRKVAVVLSWKEYVRLQALEDAWWAREARRAES
jgi:prevent-host-death family protein